MTLTWREHLLKARSVLEARSAVEGNKAADLRLAIKNIDSAVKCAGNGHIPKRATRDGSEIYRYVVEQCRGEEVLAEYRKKNPSEPFRAPMAIFGIILDTVARRDGFIDFFELSEEIRKSVGNYVPDNRSRPCIRFLVRRGLLQQFRRKYKMSCSGEQFIQRAWDAWNQARTEAFDSSKWTERLA